MLKAISVVYQCAPLYETLTQRDYLFIYKKDAHSVCFIDPVFQKHNFLHLTGLKYAGSGARVADEFYEAALGQRLKVDRVSMDLHKTAEAKLQVLPSLVALPETCRKIGFYVESGFKLHTEVLAGNLTCCMGFVLSGSGRYVPNTVLKKDMKTICRPPLHTIVAALSKEKGEQQYSRIHHVDPRTNACDLQATSFLLRQLAPDVLATLNFGEQSIDEPLEERVSLSDR
jgi:hypothetical protein